MRNNYGLGEILKNIISFAYTKMFYNKARLIRRPVFIRGKKYLQIKEGLTTGYNCRIEMFKVGSESSKKLIIGKNCKMGDYIHLAAGEKIVIGDNCLLASKIYISDISHGDYSGNFEYTSPLIEPDKRKLFTKPIFIGDNVWIGENVSILPGVNIGNGCIIGANAVVNKSIPENCIAAGVPAKIIKKYNDKKQMWEIIK